MWAFIKSIPVIVSAISSIYDMYEKWKRSQIKKKIKVIKKKHGEVINEIKQVTSDDARAELIKRLNELQF